jgi:hypothetical protein
MRHIWKHLLPWYKPEDQAARTSHTEAVVARVQESLKRVTDAQDRSMVMIRSYERAEDSLCHH